MSHRVKGLFKVDCDYQALFSVGVGVVDGIVYCSSYLAHIPAIDKSLLILVYDLW